MFINFNINPCYWNNSNFFSKKKTIFLTESDKSTNKPLNNKYIISLCGSSIFAIWVAYLIGYIFHSSEIIEKHIEISKISHEVVVKVGKPIGNITLKYKGKDVEGLELIRLKITNTSGIDIRTSDFVKPLSIDFSIKIIEAKIIRNNIDAKIDTLANSIIYFNTFIFPKNDYIELECLVTGKPQLRVNKNHILGIDNIKILDYAN